MKIKTEELTLQAFRKYDRRFLQTGSKISIQLRFSNAAGALAQANPFPMTNSRM